MANENLNHNLHHEDSEVLKEPPHGPNKETLGQPRKSRRRDRIYQSLIHRVGHKSFQTSLFRSLSLSPRREANSFHDQNNCPRRDSGKK